MTKEQCDIFNSRLVGTMNYTLGIRFLPTDDESVLGEMPINENTVQYFGNLHGGAALAMAETLDSQCQKCREQGGTAHEERHVAGLGRYQGRVLRKEIERSAGYTEENKYGLMESCGTEQLGSLVIPSFPSAIKAERPDTGIGKGEADGEYLCRLKAGRDQDFRAYEGDTPNGHYQEGKEMICQQGFDFHSFILYTVGKDNAFSKKNLNFVSIINRLQ